MSFPWKELHALENKCGTAAVSDDNPMLIELHKKLGVKTVKKRKSKKAVKLKKIPPDNELEIVNLIKDGYSFREIAKKSSFSRVIITRIAKNHGLEVKVPFKYKFNNVYLSSLDNLKHWDIDAKNTIVAKRRIRELDGEFISQKYHWGDLSQGDQYMLAGNDTEVFTK